MANGRGGRRPGAGRKPKAINEHRRTLAEVHKGDAEEAFDFIVSIMRNPAVPVALRFAAAQDVVNRVDGKPTEHHDIEGQINTDTVIRYVNDWRNKA
jgi:hypothetical protein